MLILPAIPRAAKRARKHTRRWARKRGFNEGFAYNLALVVDELVADAAKASKLPHVPIVAMELEQLDVIVVITVWDSNSYVPPVPEPASADMVPDLPSDDDIEALPDGGRGLPLVLVVAGASELSYDDSPLVGKRAICKVPMPA